jgi:hypothetical protein
VKVDVNLRPLLAYFEFVEVGIPSIKGTTPEACKPPLRSLPRSRRRGRKAILEIIDDGWGMTERELTDGFLRSAGHLKVNEPRSHKFKRHRAGRKGIGRFATERLGRSLNLTTRGASQKLGIRLLVDWDNFRPGLSCKTLKLKSSAKLEFRWAQESA